PTDTRTRYGCPHPLRSSVPLEVSAHVQLAGGVVAAHVTDFAEDRTLRPPRAVVAAEHPEDSRPGVRIAAIDGVLIVEVDQRLQVLLRRGRPFEDLFGSRHP